MTDKDRVRRIIHRLDWARIEEVGGYETEWTIAHGRLYWARLDAGKEYHAAELIVMPVATFIKKHREVLEDDSMRSPLEPEVTT